MQEARRTVQATSGTYSDIAISPLPLSKCWVLLMISGEKNEVIAKQFQGWSWVRR